MKSARNADADPFEIPGHPLNTLRRENLAVESFIENSFLQHINALETQDSPELRAVILDDVRQLAQIERHYSKIRDLMLPHLERIGFVAASKVMQNIQQDVLRMIRDLRDDLLMKDSDANGIKAFAAFLLRDIQIIIRQERESYADQAKMHLTEEQLVVIAQAFRSYGFCMIDDPQQWP